MELTFEEAARRQAAASNWYPISWFISSWDEGEGRTPTSTDPETTLQARIVQLEEEISVLEKLRPHWAKGYSSDSIAAQSTTAALANLWEMLGATNQTQAVQVLRDQAAQVKELKRTLDQTEADLTNACWAGIRLRQVKSDLTELTYERDASKTFRALEAQLAEARAQAMTPEVKAVVDAAHDIDEELRELCGFLPSNDEGVARFKAKAKTLCEALRAAQNKEGWE